MNASLIAMSGPGDVQLSNMSNLEAGLAFLGVVNQIYPGIRWSQLQDLAEGRRDLEKMGWSLNPMDAVRAVSRTVGDLKDGIGDVLKDTFSVAGGAAGDAVRLATDEKVLDGASRMANAYATSGASEGGMAAFMDFVSSLGGTVKGAASQSAAASGGLPGGVLPWALGGGGLLLTVILLSGRRN